MSWKLEFTARGAIREQRQENQRHQPNAGVTAALLVAMLVVVYARGGPRVDPLPTSLVFGTEPLHGGGPEKMLYVRNVGSAVLNVSHAALDGNHSSDFELRATHCLSEPIQPNQECPLGVTFIPQAAGERNARLIVVDDAQNSPQTVVLSGSGEPAPFTVTPDPLNFLDQTVGVTSSPRQLTVNNIGSSPLTIGHVVLHGRQNSFAIDATECIGVIIPSGQTCVINVRFTPADTHELNAHVKITDRTGDSSHEVRLFATGTKPATAVVKMPSILDFGNIEVNKESFKKLTITNVSTLPLYTGRISVTSEHAREFATNAACADSELAPDASCTLDVRFVPLASGIHKATLTVVDNARGSPQQVVLSGSGIPRPPPPVPHLLVHPVEVDFGNQKVGTDSAPQRVTLTSDGSEPVLVQGVSVQGKANKDFKITNSTCENRLLATSDQCSLEIVFTPHSKFLGKYPDQRGVALEVTDKTGNHQVKLNGVAIQPPRVPPNFTLDRRQLDFGSAQVGTKGARQGVTVTNISLAAIEVSASIRDSTFTALLTSSNRGHFQIVDTNCWSVAISPGGQCTIQVIFTPNDSGNLGAILTVIENSQGQSQSVSLSGNGTETKTGWCCTNGVISQSTRDACSGRNGTHYDDERTARSSCYPVIQ